MKISKILLIAVFFAFALMVSAQSQLTTGAISGTVQDANGAIVDGAQVTVLNEETNLTRTLITNNDGLFVAPVLPVGNYTVKIEKEGFSVLEQKNLKVNVGRTTTIIPILQIGAVAAVVTVENTPIIDTVKTDESTLISRTQINDLPINGRRADQFALLAPGVSKDGRFGLLSYRGQSGVFNNFTLEGNDDNQAYFSEAAGRTRIASNISANAIQEFQVATSNFLPEFGRSAGGGINAVVRSGGNTFHGDGFEYFRNQSLNARDPLATINPNERRDQFGGSFSGPIVKNKLFFFANYEQQLRNFPLLTQDLSGVLTTGLPATASAADRAAFARGAADLSSRFPGGAPGGTLPRKFNQNLALAKIDYNINQANSFSLTYNYLNARNLNGIQTALVLGNVGRNGSDDVRITTLNGRLTTIISPQTVNEFRFETKRDFEFEFGNEPPPQVFVGGFSFGRANFLERPALPDERRYQIVDNINYIIGNHAVKVGGDLNFVRDKINNPSNFGATYNYANALFYGRDLIARDSGIAARNYTSYTQSFGIPGLTFSTTDYSAFIQDQWRIRKNLTINYGLRYDLQRLPAPVAPNPDVPETTVINQA
ncbi:MAG: TonB-dependent receptor, partial [Acidobacteriota bacterium]|nr:TonB-dependent receptor [Acidobacteriota bacterium]